MRINQFSTTILGAKVNNQRWSWGAVDHLKRIVFLRLWDDQFEPCDVGQRVEIHWKHLALNSSGYHERTKHVGLMKAGYRGIGISCSAIDPGSNVRQINDYKDNVLYVLGEVSEEGELRL